MKVGLTSDVHGNLPALEAVLGDMPTVDRLLCAGDVFWSVRHEDRFHVRPRIEQVGETLLGEFN